MFNYSLLGVVLKPSVKGISTQRIQGSFVTRTHKGMANMHVATIQHKNNTLKWFDRKDKELLEMDIKGASYHYCHDPKL